MVRSLTIAVFAGCALAFSAFPVVAQDLALPVLGLDLDPFHIFTPAPPPAAALAAAHHYHHSHRHHPRHGHHHASKH